MKSIAEKAQRLIETHNTSDPFELCDALGINVFFSDLPEVTNGVYYNLSGRKVILINRNSDERTAAAACAHELGHALMHSQLNYRFMVSYTELVPGKYEREADYFAACILLYGLKIEKIEGMTEREAAAELKIPLNLFKIWVQNSTIFKN